MKILLPDYSGSQWTHMVVFSKSAILYLTSVILTTIFNAINEIRH